MLTDSLDLPDLAVGGAHGAGGLALVQTTSPPRAHLLDPATVQILGAVDIPWNTRTVSWDGRLALLHDADAEDTRLLDASDSASPVVRPLPVCGDDWLVGGTLVDGDLWLSGCDFAHGGILARFDLADPADPEFLGKQPWGGAVAEAVVADGCVHALTRPIVMCTPGPPSLESTQIGTSDPLPERIGYLYDSDLDPADHDAVTGDLLCRTNGHGLQVVDFSDPTAPVLRGDVSLPEDVTSERIHTSGSRVVIAGSGSGIASVGGRLFVYDISNPDAPEYRSTEICMRFRASALDGDRLYTFGVDDDLYIWRLEDNGTVTLLVEHFGDPHAPFELNDLPASEVYDFTWLRRWDRGIYWFGRTGIDLYAHEFMTIEPGAPWMVRLIWRTEADSMTDYWNGGLMDGGDRMYLGGPGRLVVDLETDPPTLLGMIPSFGGWHRLINGYPVVEGYHDLEVWAPACGTITGAPAAPPPARCSLDAWPNPFNPRLTVEFVVSEAAFAAVAVYDLRGRRLRTLTRGFHAAGRQRLQWDGCDEAGRTVAAGVYVVRLEQAGRTATRRVTIVR